jgi:hypothetical protein
MTFSCGVGVVEQFKPVSVGVTAPPAAPAAGRDATASPAAGANVNPSTSTDERVFVEEPVAASGPAMNAPTGLLALVATVCVVGIGIAAIRAIIAQRSSRASFA